MRARCAAGALCLGVLAIATPAAADEVPPAVPVYVDIDEGGVRIVGEGVDRTCGGPCEVQVPPGWYDVKTKAASQRLFFDRATRVSLVRGSPFMTKASTALLIGGGALAIAALVIPLLVCRTERSIDAFGRFHDNDPCRDLSDAVKIGWIAGGGIGLTLAVLGGVGLALSGPRLAASDLREAGATLRWRF